MNKYSISFKYLDLKGKGHKYIIASSTDEAIKKFNEIYKNYNVEIIDIKIIKRCVDEVS